MSGERDKSDEWIWALVFAIVGAVAGALFYGWQKKKEEKARRLPELLEADYYRTHAGEELEKASLQHARRLRTLSFLLWGSALLASLFVCAAVAAIPRTTYGPTGYQDQGSAAVALANFAVAAFSGYWTVRFWNERKGYRPLSAILPPPEPLDPKNIRVYTIALPRATEWQPEKAWRFMEQLLSTLGGKLTFQIIADESGVVWRLADLRLGTELPVIQQIVYAIYPEAEVRLDRWVIEPSAEPFYRYVLCFQQAGDFVGPIAHVSDLAQYDPLAAIAQAMSGVRPGERVIYTLFVACFADFAYDAGKQLITRSAVHPLQFLHPAGWIDASIKSAAGQDRVDKYVAADQSVLEDKLSSLLYQALLLIQVDAPTRERVMELACLDGYVWQFARQPFNAIMWHPEDLPEGIARIASPEADLLSSTLGLLNVWLTNTRQGWQKLRLILEPRELAALWHLPYRGMTAPNILWLSGKHTPLPAELRNNRQDVCLGDNHYGGQIAPVYLRNENRAPHMIVFGKTEMGKSTLLHNLAHQDIAQGRGVAVVDPHGNLVRDILRASIPPEREGDVVVWDLADEDYPPPLNLLLVPARYDRTQAVAQVMSVFEKMYPDFGATRMAYTLSMALSTLVVDETPTLLDVGRVLRDGGYRWRLVEQLDDPDVEMFWEDFERRTPRDQDELVLPILRRLNVFTASPALKPVLCHPQNLDFVSLIRENRIILICLRSGEGMHLPPYSQQFLGAVLVSQFQLAVMAGAAQSPYYLVIDEAQNFVTTAIPEIFNEARKRGLSLTLSNQFLRQLTGDTLDAVMGNVGAMVVFQCGEPDARAVASYMKPNFTVEDLVQLDKHQAAIFMRFEKEQLPAFSLNTRPAPQPPSEGEGQAAEARIRARSRAQSTPMSRAEVMAWLAARYPRRKRPPPGDPDEPFSDPLE